MGSPLPPAGCPGLSITAHSSRRRLACQALIERQQQLVHLLPQFYFVLDLLPVPSAVRAGVIGRVVLAEVAVQTADVAELLAEIAEARIVPGRHPAARPAEVRHLQVANFLPGLEPLAPGRVPVAPAKFLQPGAFDPAAPLPAAQPVRVDDGVISDPALVQADHGPVVAVDAPVLALGVAGNHITVVAEIVVGIEIQDAQRAELVRVVTCNPSRPGVRVAAPGGHVRVGAYA